VSARSYGWKNMKKLAGDEKRGAEF
jgi:hypothetical protein